MFDLKVGKKIGGLVKYSRATFIYYLSNNVNNEMYRKIILIYNDINLIISTLQLGLSRVFNYVQKMEWCAVKKPL